MDPQSIRWEVDAVITDVPKTYKELCSSVASEFEYVTRTNCRHADMCV